VQASTRCMHHCGQEHAIGTCPAQRHAGLRNLYPVAGLAGRPVVPSSDAWLGWAMLGLRCAY
jgi:hypothetical protein